MSKTLTFGSVVHLANAQAGVGYLDSRDVVSGRTAAFPGAVSTTETCFVTTHPGGDRDSRGSTRWTIVSADGKAVGADIVSGDRVRLLNAFPNAGYLDSYGAVATDLPTFAAVAPKATCGVFTCGKSDREQVTGTWTISKVGASAGAATPIGSGERVLLANGLTGAGSLVAHGSVAECAAFSDFTSQKLFVFTSTDADLVTTNGAWTVSEAFDTVPITWPASLDRHAAVQLSGTAIKDPAGLELQCDTGSWTLSVRETLLDTTKITYLTRDTTDSWGHPAHKVSGQVSLLAANGKAYTVDDYTFFATTTDTYPSTIMGAFPGTEQSTQLTSLPYAIAQNFPSCGSGGAAGVVGFGFANGPSGTSLFFGGDPSMITDKMRWRTDWKDITFGPEMVKGFTVSLEIARNSSAKTTLASGSLRATLDTGAPEMILRLSQDDPQTKDANAASFTRDGYWKDWKNDDYTRDARMLQGDAVVTVGFTDDQGRTSNYSFSPDAAANRVALAAWNGAVPWPVHDPDKPRDRFNIGSTIFRLCPVVFFDITNKRVGVQFPG